MTTRELFSDEEWGQVTALAGEVIVAACVSDGHLMPGVRELRAGVEALSDGAKRYPDNPVLQALLSTASSPSGEPHDPHKVNDAEGALALLVAGIEAGVAVARAHLSREEYGQLREVLTASAHAVVERLGAGFMGSGDKVTASEQAFEDRLAAILA